MEGPLAIRVQYYMNNKDCMLLATLLVDSMPNNLSSFFLLDPRIEQYYNQFKNLYNIDEEIETKFNYEMNRNYGFTFRNRVLTKKEHKFPEAGNILRSILMDYYDEENTEIEFNRLKQIGPYTLYFDK